MKKTIIICTLIFTICVLVLIGGYVITSFALKTYITLKEENDWIDISMVIKDATNEDISRELLSQWLEVFKKRRYVSTIESYMIHSITIEEEHETYFIFSSKYSVVTYDSDTSWKNYPHTEHDGVFTFDRKFRVNKVGDKYYFRTVIDATDVDFAR